MDLQCPIKAVTINQSIPIPGRGNPGRTGGGEPRPPCRMQRAVAVTATSQRTAGSWIQCVTGMSTGSSTPSPTPSPLLPSRLESSRICLLVACGWLELRTELDSADGELAKLLSRYFSASLPRLVSSTPSAVPAPSSRCRLRSAIGVQVGGHTAGGRL